jgi:uncharacterized protein YacL
MPSCARNSREAEPARHSPDLSIGRRNFILVTGGVGFIGSNFVLAWLGQSDERVVNLDKLTYFASGWSIFSMVYFMAVTFAPPAAAGQRIADTILSVLIASVVGVMFSYFYGSTKNSAEKTRLLAQSAPPSA